MSNLPSRKTLTDAAVGKIVNDAIKKAAVVQAAEASQEETAKVGMKAVGKLVGIEDLAEFSNPYGAALGLALYMSDQAQAEDAEQGRISAAQDADNVAQHAVSTGIVDNRNKGASQGAEDFDAKWKASGHQENAPGAGDSKTAADNAIRNAFAKQSMVDLRTQVAKQADKDAADDSPISKKLADAKAGLNDAESTDFIPGGGWGIPLFNYTKAEGVKAAQGARDDAQQDVDRNTKERQTLKTQINRAGDEAAAAKVDQYRAEDAALNTAPGPAAAPAANPVAPPVAAPPSPAMQQLVQQQAGANQVLSALLDATRKGNADELALLHELVACQVDLQLQINGLRTQLHNLQSTGLH